MDDRRPHGSSDQAITRQCTARSKRSGERCRKHAMRGRTVCLAHGGKTPRGAASPHFKTGRYSRSLPGHLLAVYEQALRDPRLLSLRDEIALTDAMICELLSQIDNDISESAERRIFRQMRRLIDQRRRLVETEVRHIVLAREVVTAEEMRAAAGDGCDRHALRSGPQRPTGDRRVSTDRETPLGVHTYG